MLAPAFMARIPPMDAAAEADVLSYRVVHRQAY
jgi:hypothetical protein